MENELESEIAARLTDWRSCTVSLRRSGLSEAKSERVKAHRSKRISIPNSTENVGSKGPKTAPKEPKEVEENRAAVKSPLTDVLITNREQHAGTWKEPPIRSLSTNIGIRNSQEKGGAADLNDAKRHNEVDALKFVEQHRFEIGSLGSSALRKRDRKGYEESQLLRMGFRPRRNHKIPIGHLQGMRKKRKDIAKKMKERQIEEGNAFLVKRKKSRNS